MENTRLPAYPLPLVQNSEGDVKDASDWGGNMGFTKLELASLMIAQGLMSNTLFCDNEDNYIARDAVKLAKAVLEEANK
jgi:hypothetical protein